MPSSAGSNGGARSCGARNSSFLAGIQRPKALPVARRIGQAGHHAQHLAVVDADAVIAVVFPVEGDARAAPAPPPSRPNGPARCRSSTPSKSKRMASNAGMAGKILSVARQGVVSRKLNTMPTEEELKAEIERLRAENESLKKPARGAMSLKVSEKGALSVYGLGRFPVTLYREQWEKLLGMADQIRQFIQDNDHAAQEEGIAHGEGHGPGHGRFGRDRGGVGEALRGRRIRRGPGGAQCGPPRGTGGQPFANLRQSRPALWRRTLPTPRAPRRIFEQTRGDTVEILINNAGFGLRGAYAETDWERRGATDSGQHRSALAHLTKLFLPEMLRRGSRAHPERRLPPRLSSRARSWRCTMPARPSWFRFHMALANEVTGHGRDRHGALSRPHAARSSRAAAGMRDSKLFEGPTMTRRGGGARWV